MQDAYLSRFRLLLFLAGAVFLAACGELHSPASPEAEPQASLTTDAVSLVQCPTNFTRSTTGTIGPDGGTLSLEGSSVTVPPGAVDEPHEFTVVIPASPYMEVRYRVDDEATFQFDKPVTLTIDYNRCSRSNLLSLSLIAAHIDIDTKAILALFPDAVDDKEERTVTFETDHFSGYALAN